MMAAQRDARFAGTLTPNAPRNVILTGDALSVLRTLPDACVQVCVTSPPYFGLRSYGTTPVVWGGVSTCAHQWHDNTCGRCLAWRGELGQENTPAKYVDHLVQVLREVGRVLRHDGTLWLNLGDAYSNDTKWGGGTAPVLNLTSRAGGHQGQRVRRNTGVPPKSLLGMPWRVAFALQDEGWILRSDIVWAKPDGMPEKVTDRPTHVHEYIFLFSKQPKYYYNADAIREPHAYDWEQTTGTYRAGKAKHQRGGRGTGSRAFRSAPNPLGRNSRSVWELTTDPFPGAHYAVMPVAIAERCVLAGSRSGDLVLDPFAGRGTVGLAAKANGRDYLLIDAKPENAQMAHTFIARGGKWSRDSEKATDDAPTLWEES